MLKGTLASIKSMEPARMQKMVISIVEALDCQLWDINAAEKIGNILEDYGIPTVKSQCLDPEPDENEQQMLDKIRASFVLCMEDNTDRYVTEHKRKDGTVWYTSHLGAPSDTGHRTWYMDGTRIGEFKNGQTIINHYLLETILDGLNY
jgi:hypothetical protein